MLVAPQAILNTAVGVTRPGVKVQQFREHFTDRLKQHAQGVGVGVVVTTIGVGCRGVGSTNTTFW